MKLNPFVLTAVIVLLAVETIFTVGLLGQAWWYGALTVALPAVLSLYFSVDCGRAIFLSLFNNAKRLDRQLLGLIILAGYLLMVPVLPALVIWMGVHVLTESTPGLEAISVTAAHRAAFSLATMHGLLMLGEMPGSIRALRERLSHG